MLFPRVSATIMLVDTGIPKTEADVAALMKELAERSETGEAPPYPPPTLNEVLATLPMFMLSTHWISRRSTPMWSR